MLSVSVAGSSLAVPEYLAIRAANSIKIILTLAR